jgi:hypothetical protein
MAANASLAFSYQKEWSIATAPLNCGCTAAAQETGKLTLPSLSGSPPECSCWATAVAAIVSQAAPITRDKALRNLMSTSHRRFPGRDFG